MTWLPAAKPRSSGRAPFTVSLLQQPLIHFLLSSAGQGRSFEAALPRLDHEADWRRCALCANRDVTPALLIVISLAPAYTAINTDSDPIFLSRLFFYAAIHKVHFHQLN